MAYCPKCNGEIATTAIECSHCGYDFAAKSRANANPGAGFAESSLADMAIIAVMLAAAMGCCGALYGTIVSLCFGQLFAGLVIGPIVFFVLLGLFVVALRVQR